LGPSPVGALVGFFGSLLVTAVFGLYRLESLGLKGVATDRSLVWPLVTNGLKSQVATISLTLTYRSDLLLVTHFLGVAQAGVYSVALTLSEMLRVVAEAAQVLVVTRATSADIEQHAALVARQSAVLTLIAGLLMASLSASLVPVVFGASFAGAIKAVWCLVPGSIALALSFSLSPLLVLQGRLLLNGVAASVGLGVLWTVGAWGPGAPSLAKFGLASSMAYWAIAVTQIGCLWWFRRVDPIDLLPTYADLQGLVKNGKLIARGVLE
jgi:O-antigen/teichoic acid export membrane protein